MPIWLCPNTLRHFARTGGLSFRSHRQSYLSFDSTETDYLGGMSAGTSRFWENHRGLVWSNPNASDSVHIRAALLHPRFSQLLDIAVKFGLERLREEWTVLQAEDTPRARQACHAVERILHHIEEGFTRAATGL